MVKTNGARVLAAWESWISSWVAFPAQPGDQALILALWAIHTWFAPSWPATAYLFVTSEGPGCGKTTLMEVLASLACRPRVRATMRALSVVRDIAEQANAVTYFFDQVEALVSAKITDDKAILLTGYRRGGEHGVSVGTKQMAFSTYCAKCFACVGKIAADLESRCFVAMLGYGVPERGWTDSVMSRDVEARELLTSLRAVEGMSGGLPWFPPSFLGGREKEIATPIWSVAVALGLDDAGLARVQAALVGWFRWSERESAGRKVYRDLVGGKVDEGDRRAVEFEALRDLAAVMPIADKRHTGDMATVDVIDAMMTYNRRWVRFGGSGLDAQGLAALVLRFGVEPVPIRVRRGPGRQVRGYSGKKVAAAWKLAERAMVASVEDDSAVLS